MSFGPIILGYSVSFAQTETRVNKYGSTGVLHPWNRKSSSKGDGIDSLGIQPVCKVKSNRKMS